VFLIGAYFPRFGLSAMERSPNLQDACLLYISVYLGRFEQELASLALKFVICPDFHFFSRSAIAFPLAVRMVNMFHKKLFIHEKGNGIFDPMCIYSCHRKNNSKCQKNSEQKSGVHISTFRI
jgi:hypothetical protein